MTDNQPTLPIPRRLPGATVRFLDWFATQPPVEDPTGRALGKLHAGAIYAGVYSASTNALSSLLKGLDADGLVDRTINGKRCYRIAYAGPPRGNPVEAPDIPVEEPPVDIPSESDLDHVDPEDPDTWTPEPIPTPLPEAPALVGRVRLELDLDPAMARMVLDFVERGDGIRPIDRGQARLLIAESVNKATERTAAGTARLMDRLTAVEADVAAIANAMRSLGAQPATSNGNRRQTRPDFRSLGVKDSQLRVLLTDLVNDGWSLAKNNGGHVTATKPDHQPLQLPATPSDHRAVRNARSQARQLGANL